MDHNRLKMSLVWIWSLLLLIIRYTRWKFLLISWLLHKRCCKIIKNNDRFGLHYYFLFKLRILKNTQWINVTWIEYRCKVLSKEWVDTNFSGILFLSFYVSFIFFIGWVNKYNRTTCSYFLIFGTHWFVLQRLLTSLYYNEKQPIQEKEMVCIICIIFIGIQWVKSCSVLWA